MVSVSVVIPVYKVEAYLDGCVESVLAQAFKDFEIILVDDGSPDRCPRMCDEWAGKDARIHVVHKENGGLDSARKAGIAHCTGEVTVFLDSDDLLMPDALQPIADYMSQNPGIDLLQTGYRILFPDGRETDMCDFSKLFPQGEPIDGMEFLRNDCLDADTLWNAWSKAYRTAYLKKINMQPLEKYACEDVESLVTYCIYGCTIAYLDILLIAFRSQREGSITTGMSVPYMCGYNRSMARISGQLKNAAGKQIPEIRGYFAKMTLLNCQNALSLPPEQKREVLASLDRAIFTGAQSSDLTVQRAFRLTLAIGIGPALGVILRFKRVRDKARAVIAKLHKEH